MLEELTSREVTEWLAFLQLEEIGESLNFRADVRSAVIASTIANVHRGKAKAFELTDFMPFQPRRSIQQSDDQLHAALTKRADADAARMARRAKVAADAGDAGETVRRARAPRQGARRRSRPEREGS